MLFGPEVMPFLAIGPDLDMIYLQGPAERILKPEMGRRLIELKLKREIGYRSHVVPDSKA